ncbi:hypothetical protein SBA7_300066 [Candidatus Sulfotelmatobacter sp. SbA7]|nr:hypothetical protein SBA7_300066 [Candidatus Sulfotelmatobacter sp. SbA7]
MGFYPFRGPDASLTLGRMVAQEGDGMGLSSNRYRRSLPAVDWGQEAFVLQGFGFAGFEFRLAKLGGLFGTGSRFEFGLFAEITPACLTLFHTLAALVLLGGGFGVLLAFDYGRDPARLIGANVVTDYRVGSSKFFAVQTVSGLRWIRGRR